MLETLRRYWIAMLVLVMIGLHASIVGLIRYQASLAKVDASCEVDLGSFLAFQSGGKPPISMQLHAIVPCNHRMKSRQLIELNQSQIRQSLEEHLRQIDGRVLTDPYLTDLRTQLLDVMVQTIGSASIEELTITKVFESKDANTLEFISRANARQPRQLVATLRNQQPSTHDEEHSADEEHADGDHESHGDHGEHGEHGEHSAKPAAKTSHADAKSSGGAHGDSHGAAKPKAKASTSHGAASKKPAPAKKSGH